MSDQLERLLSANKELQDNMEVLQTELGRKQTEFEKLLDERYFRNCGNSSFLLFLRSWWPVNSLSSRVWCLERARRKSRNEGGKKSAVLFPHSNPRPPNPHSATFLRSTSILSAFQAAVRPFQSELVHRLISHFPPTSLFPFREK